MENKYRLINEELLKETSSNPIDIIRKIMKKDFINIHGPEHHYLDGASLITALHNAGLKMNLQENLNALSTRSSQMPGAMCGYWGICGSVASIGAAFSIIDNTGPLSNDSAYSDHMKLTSNIIATMSKIGGPRCCKRNAFISLLEACKYANKKYNLNIPLETIKCDFSPKNAQCLKENCPFFNK